MGYTRAIRCQYYQIKMFKKERDKRKVVEKYDGLFDFHEWAKAIKDNDAIQKLIEFRTTKARVEKINIKDSIWEMRLLKLRDTNIPSKAKDNVDATVVELDEGEYIGEDVYIIYDSDTGIAMIQNNRLSLGLSRIEELFQFTYAKYIDNEGIRKVKIQPIADLDRETRLSGKYRQLEISFANINNYCAEGKTSLASLLKPFKNLDGITGTIKIGLGRAKDVTLNGDKITALAEEMKDDSNKRYIRSAKVTVQEEDDADVETVDLFEENCHDYVMFDVEARESLQFEEVISKMRNSYKSRKDDLLRYTNQGVDL